LLDHHSLSILRALQRDARLTLAQLSEQVGLSPTPCWKRVKDMEASGVITRYSALVNRERVGLGLAVMVEVNLGQHSEDTVRRFEAAVLACPAVVRCVSTTGAADYMLTVLTADIAHYEHLLHDTLFRLPGVSHVRSAIVLKEVKSEVALPIAESALAATAARQR
jgi:Lrp/AsnC family transcriptional regulator, leucine-responsive regulatory protein